MGCKKQYNPPTYILKCFIWRYSNWYPNIPTLNPPDVSTLTNLVPGNRNVEDVGCYYGSYALLPWNTDVRASETGSCTYVQVPILTSC